jgi:hypothetical protein
VEEILNKKPLRERFSALLPKELKLPISSEHMHLLKVQAHIDQTIMFLQEYRCMKSVFFADLRRHLIESIRLFIEFEHLQQICFLDEAVYKLSWVRN